MICEECKRCFNFEVGELGCRGSDEPCEWLVQDNQDYYETLESIKRGMY